LADARGYDSNVFRITGNFLRRFLDPTSSGAWPKGYLRFGAVPARSTARSTFNLLDITEVRE
jgi:hypothetical protein